MCVVVWWGGLGSVGMLFFCWLLCVDVVVYWVGCWICVMVVGMFGIVVFGIGWIGVLWMGGDCVLLVWCLFVVDCYGYWFVGCVVVVFVFGVVFVLLLVGLLVW